MQVLPPANGKRMWRVKKCISTRNAKAQKFDSSRECLNNSLKISAAAGKQFVMKRPAMKRPKTISGQRKDFVFVDLSPVKSESDDILVTSSVIDESVRSSMSLYQESDSPLSVLNDSSKSTNSNENDQHQRIWAQYDMQTSIYDDLAIFDMGTMNTTYSQKVHSSGSTQSPQIALDSTRNFDFSQSQPSQPPQHQQCMSIAYNVDEFIYKDQKLGPHFSPSPSIHEITPSTSVISERKSAGGLQYMGPIHVSNPIPNRINRTMSQYTQEAITALPISNMADVTTQELHCMTTPAIAVPEFDFFSQIISSGFDLDYEKLSSTFSPITDSSDSDGISGLLDPINLELFPSTKAAEGSISKNEIDFLSFVAI